MLKRKRGPDGELLLSATLLEVIASLLQGENIYYRHGKTAGARYCGEVPLPQAIVLVAPALSPSHFVHVNGVASWDPADVNAAYEPL